MRVLIVEDDPRLGEFLVRVLREEGSEGHLKVDAASGLRATGARAGEAAPPFDAIVLDWMLPDGDGPSFCEALRRANVQTPVLMLTARGEVPDRVRGLRSGADDYLVKPFEVEELIARLDALVRRSQNAAPLVVGPLALDRVRRLCTLRSAALDLTVREYELLLRLASEGGGAVTRADLLKDVWKMDFDPGSGLLDVQVSRLRDKLGADSNLIETVRGVGYRLRSRS